MGAGGGLVSDRRGVGRGWAGRSARVSRHRRQQALGDATPLAGRSLPQALLLLARQEGVAGMFKGLSLNLIKNPMGTAVSFVVNDAVKD